MQTELFLYCRPVRSIFELLGTKENDITFSLGWALAQSDHLRDALLRRLFPSTSKIEVDRVNLQKHEGDLGITDIEFRGPGLHVIVEAKRGWELPTAKQLLKYASRISRLGSASDLM